MTKIHAGTNELSWSKASLQPSVAHNSSPVSPAATTPDTPRADLTRFTPSASALGMIVNAETTLQQQDHQTQSQISLQDAAAQRSLAELPYLAHPERSVTKRVTVLSEFALQPVVRTSHQLVKSVQKEKNRIQFPRWKWVTVCIFLLLLFAFL